MSVICITSLQHFDNIVRTQKAVLVDFHATWCGPCKAMKPIVENLAKQYQDKLHVLTVDTDQNPSIAQKYGVKGLPTFLLFYRGTAVRKIVGANPEKLKEFVEELCMK